MYDAEECLATDLTCSRTSETAPRANTCLFGVPTATLKNIYEVDITDATDVSGLGGCNQLSVGGTALSAVRGPACS